MNPEMEWIRRNPELSGIFTDIDGTISDIAPSPGMAFVDAEFRELLRELSMRYRICGAITGRDVRNASEMVGVRELFYSGNHGLETLYKGEYSASLDAERYGRIYRDILSKLRLPDGVLIEDKGLIMAFHYREHPEIGNELCAALSGATGNNEDVTLMPDSMVYELRPAARFGKGDAIASCIREFGLRGVFYSGNGLTDIDALKEIERARKDGIHSFTVWVSGWNPPEGMNEKPGLVVYSVDGVKQAFRYLLD